MKTDEKWVYENGKLTEKVTTKTDDEGHQEIIRQDAYTDCLGSRHATDVTSRTKETN